MELAIRFHEVYLETAKRLGWPIRSEVNVPFVQLSEDAKALDYALADETLKMIRAAVEAKREAWAMVAADKAEQYRGEPWERVPHAHTILLELAAAIRARQEPK